MTVNDYIKINTFQERVANSGTICENFPRSVPVICFMDPYMNTKKTYYKFLVNKDITLSAMTFVIRKKIELDHHHSIFILNERNELLSAQTTMGMLYQLHRNQDGFLYFFARKENCFGHLVNSTFF
jgi:hypothetical protein